MDPVIVGYAAYLLITIFLVVWVGRALAGNGLVFIRDALRGNEPLAEAVSKLLQIGFYLLNLGFVALAMATGLDHPTPREVMESMAGKLGLILVLLGAIHLANVLVLNRMRNRVTRVRALPPGPAL